MPSSRTLSGCEVFCGVPPRQNTGVTIVKTINYSLMRPESAVNSQSRDASEGMGFSLTRQL
ncbi:hypothetical protein [Pontibacter fetidus]|uniref:Uncharacterized protein n=1 Tax=Pontibacter fetidus TaxID=2700082 RepID=A0A6B2GXH6_9BACT|nr:hypothetical protein [Pontibacter fetidus]NDK55545.1 hypothetical protein [Pontibacter fetidus]